MSRRKLLLAGLALLLGGCASTWQRLNDGAGPPKMTATADPTKDPNYRPVSLPMPHATATGQDPNSLWHPGSRAFFPDQRAAHVGDIVTVVVNIIDTAVLANQTQTTRAGNEAMAVPNMFGLETIHKLLPKNGGNMVTTNSTNTNNGTASINRSETITLRVAGVITQELPNGNLAVVARQEVRVNQELRELVVSGVVRPQDIASDNTVQHDRMAEARIAYGGRGQLTDLQRARWGQQILDVLMPF